MNMDAKIAYLIFLFLNQEKILEMWKQVCEEWIETFAKRYS